MRKLIYLLLLAAYVLQAQELPSGGQKLWKVSMVTLTAANSLDMQSSWGKHELNRALTDSRGTFGVQGALIKMGLQGGLMGMEYLLTRGHSKGRMYRMFSAVNFGASAAMGAIAIRNYGVR